MTPDYDRDGTKMLLDTLRAVGAPLAIAMVAAITGAAVVLILNRPDPEQSVPPPMILQAETASSHVKKSDSLREIPLLTNSEPIVIPVGQGRIVRFEQPAESVFIGDPTVADLHIVTPDTVYIFGKRNGTTNLLAVARDDDSEDAEKKIQVSSVIKITGDAGPANEALRQIQPSSAIKLSLLGHRAVAEGTAKSVTEAVDAEHVAQSYSDQPPIDNTVIEGSQQVNIRIKFAEVSRNNLQSFGIDWHVLAGNFSIGVVNGAGAVSRSSMGPSMGIGVKGSNFDVNLLIEALQRNGLVTILAEPNLTAVSGQTADFLAGGEIPVPIPQQQSNLITVEYKPFGVSLHFTPTIIGRERIALRVRPEVSSLSTVGSININGFSLPSFTVRRADTTVEVASGQTFAIAGLLQRQMYSDLAKFPVAGDVPILGQLFRSEKYQRDETELVILITPLIVKPVKGRLATPLDQANARHSPPPQAQPVAVAERSLKDTSHAKRAHSTPGAGLILK